MEKGKNRQLVSQVMENTEKRVVVSFEGIVEAGPEKVFPLLCPKREELWIEGWLPGVYDLIFSHSGFNEKNCVFQEGFTAKFLFNLPGPTTWVTTAYEPQDFTLEFLLIFGETAALNRAVACLEPDKGVTLARWVDTVTFLKGPMEENAREVLLKKLNAFSFYLGVMLREYCEQGRMLPLSAFFEGPVPEGLDAETLGFIRGLFG